MSYCEGYIDPFDDFCEHGRIDCAECRSEVEEDEERECAYPDECVMPGVLHHRSECHTAADAEAYYAEVLREEQQA